MAVAAKAENMRSEGRSESYEDKDDGDNEVGDLNNVMREGYVLVCKDWNSKSLEERCVPTPTVVASHSQNVAVASTFILYYTSHTYYNYWCSMLHISFPIFADTHFFNIKLITDPDFIQQI